MTSLRSLIAPCQRVLTGGVAVLLFGLFTSLPAVSFGPPLTLFQDIPPGYEVDLKKVANFSFRITNKTKKEQVYTVKCVKPAASQRGSWEYGYEAIPDISWCKMQVNEVMVPAETKKHVSMTISIPDKPENYNRKFVVFVQLQQGGRSMIGVGLGIIARVMVETTVKADVSKLGGESIAFAPGQITLSGKPGSEFTAEVLIQNNEKQDLIFNQTKLSDFYEPMRFARYQSSGFKLMPDKTWLTPIANQEIKAEAQQKLKISGKIPEDAKPGTNYEEVLFIKSHPKQTAKGLTKEEQEEVSLAKMSFLRIQYIVE